MANPGLRNRPPPISNRTWTQSSNISLLNTNPVTVVRTPTFAPLQKSRPLPPSDYPNLLESTLGIVVTASPFYQTDWTNPSIYTKKDTNVNRGYVDQSEFWMLQDTFFGLAGSPNFDQPNPRGHLQPTANKTHLQNAGVFQVDTFFGLAGSPNFDWPVPKVKQPNVTLKTWVEPTKLNLLGQDTFFAGAGLGPNYDWPNPITPKRSIGLLTSGEANNLPLVTVVVYAFAQYDWANPIQPRRAVSLLTSDTNVIPLNNVVYAFTQCDWPVPRGYQRSVDSLTHLESIDLTSLRICSNFYVRTNTQNAEWGISGNTWSTSTSSKIGNKPTNTFGRWDFFTGITIPQGTPLRATLTFYGPGTGAGSLVRAKTYCDDTVTSTMPSTAAQAAARGLTQGKAWTVENIGSGYPTQWSVDVTEQVQEIINDPTWQSGFPLSLVTKDDGSSSNNFITSYNRANDPATAAWLDICPLDPFNKTTDWGDNPRGYQFPSSLRTFTNSQPPGLAAISHFALGQLLVYPRALGAMFNDPQYAVGILVTSPRAQGTKTVDKGQ